jgi:hypothetical protein
MKLIATSLALGFKNHMEKFEGGKNLHMNYDVFTTRKMSPLKKKT